MRLFFALPILCLLAMACGTEATDPVAAEPDTNSANGVVDDLPTDIPELGDATLMEFPEQLIESGTEVQNCLYMEPLEEEMFVSHFNAYQGQFGHHLLMFTSVIDKPPGTVAECGSEASMATLLPAVFASNFVPSLPGGMAIRLAKGAQIVIQQHYVNTSLNTIRVADAVHLFKVPAADVTEEIGFYGLSDIGFKVPPGEGSKTLTFDCEVPRDLQLLIAGPHMHEWGTGYRASLVPQTGDPIVLSEVGLWDADFRDVPPVSEFFSSRVEAKTGDVVRVECKFENDTDKNLQFPKEMCAVYGYISPATPTEPNWICAAKGTVE